MKGSKKTEKTIKFVENPTRDKKKRLTGPLQERMIVITG